MSHDPRGPEGRFAALPTVLLTIVPAILLLLVPALSWSGEPAPLRARGMAGFAFGPVPQAPSAMIGSAPSPGVIVIKVLPGSPAAKSGLRPGDIIRKYGPTTIPDPSAMLTALSNVYAGDRIEIEIFRQGHPAHLFLTLAPFPRDFQEGIELEYTSFSRGEARFRAVVHSPANSSGKALPGLLIVSALGSPRLIRSEVYDMSREIACAAASGGFRVLRFELRGSGDSEGEDYRQTDFLSEIADNAAALDFLRNRPDIDPKRIFLFGHSTGGIIAGILAGTGRFETASRAQALPSGRETGPRPPLAGVILSCTIGRDHLERIAATIRLQGELDGKSYPEIEKSVRNHLTLCTLLADGMKMPEIASRHPELAQAVNSSGRIMDDRTDTYWQQQLGFNLAEVYQAIRCPALVIYGESDFLTTRPCHETICKTIRASGNGSVRFEAIPGMDHKYSIARDYSESARNYNSNSFRENPRGKATILEWLGQTSTASSPSGVPVSGAIPSEEASGTHH